MRLAADTWTLLQSWEQLGLSDWAVQLTAVSIHIHREQSAGPSTSAAVWTGLQ